MIWDYVKLGYNNVKKEQLRSWLTMIGIIISIAAIFVIVSLSLGLQDAVEEQFRLLGTDKFFVQPRGQLGPPGTGGSIELTDGDVDEIEKISGVKKLTPMIVGNAKIEHNDEVRYSLAIGMELETADLFLESGGFGAQDGRNLQEGDSGAIAVGYDYRYGSYLDTPIDVGDKLLINDVSFRVVGVMGRVGNPQDDRQIYMEIEEARELFGIPTRIDFITVQIDEGEDVAEIAEKVKKRLDKSRDVDDKTRDYTILTPEQILEVFGNILGIITGFLFGIAMISLIVGGIGVANTMYTSVVKRTKEIGVMKAIGAKNSDITVIFVIESGFIGLAGGLIGVLVGFGIGKLVEWIAITQLGTTLLKAAAPWYLFAGCLLFAFLAGAISGTLPAIQASRIQPVEALRYE